MIPVSNSESHDEFVRSARRIGSDIVEAIHNQGLVEDVVRNQLDPIYIKSIDGTILLTNRAYNATFSSTQSPLGRMGSSFLTDSIVSISSLSDAMIADGCASLFFEHVGHDVEGREMRFLTHKRSLLGQGHPTMAILGITRPLELISTGAKKPRHTLRQHWHAFNGLDELDRNIAVGLARGKNVTAIAVENGVTKKTIENHRAAILRAFGFDSPIDVVKLIVRFQENGFGDFAV